MDIFIIIALITASGMFSGLTIGLMGLSVDEVQRSSDLGDRNALRVLPIVKQGNLLLVTLLLGNTAVNATLSIFLGGVVGEGVVAGVIATLLILIFGEVLPAAILTRHALFVGARVAGVVKILMFILYPFAGPIAMVLDRALGAEIPELLNRRELRHVIETHQKSDESDIDTLDRDLILGALSLQEKRVENIMTPREKVHTVALKDELNEEKIFELKKSGYTRFPVLQDDRIVGVLNIKRLLGGTPEESTVEDYSSGQKFVHIPTDAKADDMLHRMIKGKVHMATVTGHSGWVGIVTMEDILEELVGHEISDEFGH
ncbi:MAG: CNNM domain-containing protein [Campylobacterota bacterium]|nr:CNNM domain-containing protein [Campylobacterota bacterium]